MVTKQSVVDLRSLRYTSNVIIKTNNPACNLIARSRGGLFEPVSYE